MAIEIKKVCDIVQENGIKCLLHGFSGNGKIKRDMGITQEWAIETDDILSFIDKCDDPVIISKNDDKEFYTIEIYDDWRE